MTSTAPIGLRARKRVETAATIERAAIRLVSEHGYDGVTVDMICALAAVSPGTFYNYFGTKDGVFLGTELPMPTDAAVTEFIQGGGSVVADLVTMIESAFENIDIGLLAAKREVITTNPVLTSREHALMGGLEDRLLSIVLERFDRLEPGTGDRSSAAARTVVGLAVLVHRQLVTQQLAGDRDSALDFVRSQLALIHQLTRPES